MKHYGNCPSLEGKECNCKETTERSENSNVELKDFQIINTKNKPLIFCTKCKWSGENCKCQPEQSLRLNEGKVQLREVDPAFILGIGEVLTKSREKYEEGNWMKETKLSTPYESAMRHLLAFWAGDDVDKETLQSHLLHCATNLMFLHYHMTSGKGIDDRLFKKKK